jgi:hypothetical protein
MKTIYHNDGRVKKEVNGILYISQEFAGDNSSIYMLCITRVYLFGIPIYKSVKYERDSENLVQTEWEEPLKKVS